jgi:Recombination endonuclease VII
LPRGIRLDWSRTQYCVSCPNIIVPYKKGLRIKDLDAGTSVHSSNSRCYNCARGSREGYTPRSIPIYDEKIGLECKDCHEILPLVDFNCNPSGRRFPACKRCSFLKYFYNITKAQYTELLSSQGYQCAICMTDVSKVALLCIDHDHSCCPQKARSCGKCIRGLLCSKCNKGIGLFDDDIKSLRSAIKYLESTKVRNP